MDTEVKKQALTPNKKRAIKILIALGVLFVVLLVAVLIVNNCAENQYVDEAVKFLTEDPIGSSSFNSYYGKIISIDTDNAEQIKNEENGTIIVKFIVNAERNSAVKCMVVFPGGTNENVYWTTYR
jgi:flagellar basal body-associated protein FliL